MNSSTLAEFSDGLLAKELRKKLDNFFNSLGSGWPDKQTAEAALKQELWDNKNGIVAALEAIERLQATNAELVVSYSHWGMVRLPIITLPDWKAFRFDDDMIEDAKQPQGRQP